MKHFLVIVCVFLQGCGGFFSAADPLQTTFLTPSLLPSQQQEAVIPKKMLKIYPPLLPAWLDSQRFFLKEGFLMSPLDDISLIEPLGEHFMYHLFYSLKNSNLYKSVAKEGESLSADYSLTPYIEAFWIEKEGSYYKALLKISVRLIEEESQHLVFHRSHECFYPLEKWSQAWVVKGLEKVLHQCIKWTYAQLGTV